MHERSARPIWLALVVYVPDGGPFRRPHRPQQQNFEIRPFRPQLRGMAAVLERAAGSTDLRSCACLGFILIAIGMRMKVPRRFRGYGRHRRHNRHAHFGMPHRALGARNFKTDSVVSAWRGVVPSWEVVQAGFVRLCGSHPKKFLQKPDLETTWIWRAEQIKLGI